MKYLKIIIGLLLAIPLTVSAQNNKRMTSFEIGKLTKDRTDASYVKQGEFIVDFKNRIYDQNTNVKTYKYSVITRDQKAMVRTVMMNNYLMNFSSLQYSIDVLRMGYTIPEFVYIEKRDASSVETGKYKYTLHVGDAGYGPYDAIVEVQPKGFVYKNMGIYSYRKYKDDMAGKKDYCVVERQVYPEQTVKCKVGDKTLAFNVVGSVDYYRSHDGHYYLLYNDKDMDNTFMVVDSVGYEMDSFTQSILFKFSHDGKHWIAAGNDYVIVDGLTVMRKAGQIKAVGIKNDGKYSYVVKGDEYGDRVFMNDNMMVKGVELLNLTVDDEERFNYIFRDDNGYSYGIDRDIKSFNDNMNAYYYPALFDNEQTFTVKSADGKHTMSFKYDQPYIMIDGKRLDCNSIPHYAVWDNGDNCFMWNAVEGSKLLIYKYKVNK